MQTAVILQAVRNGIGKKEALLTDDQVESGLKVSKPSICGPKVILITDFGIMLGHLHRLAPVSRRRLFVQDLNLPPHSASHQDKTPPESESSSDRLHPSLGRHLAVPYCVPMQTPHAMECRGSGSLWQHGMIVVFTEQGSYLTMLSVCPMDCS